MLHVASLRRLLLLVLLGGSVVVAADRSNIVTILSDDYADGSNADIPSK